MIVKDAMVVIHLAKLTLLRKSCEYFEQVAIPKEVYNEIMAGEQQGHPDAKTIIELVKMKHIQVKDLEGNSLIKRAKEFSIQRGEAEAIALYWQEKADYLATDDDNVRKKSILLDIKIIGTPVIILKLYKEQVIGKDKFMESLAELKKIGWFSNAVIDTILMEGLKWSNQ